MFAAVLLDRMGGVWKSALLAVLVLGTLVHHTKCQDVVCKVKADLALIIDSSGSIRDNNPSDGSYDNWNKMKEFIADAINAFTIGPDDTRVAAVKFSNNGNFLWGLNNFTDKNTLLNAIKNIAYSGGRTNTAAGLRITRESVFGGLGNRAGVPNIAIVITDGVSTVDNSRTLPEADLLKSYGEGVKVFAIGITAGIDEEELRKISSQPQEKGRTYWTNPDFTSLSNVIGNLVSETCTVIQSTPSPVTVSSADCPVKADITILLDASGSITWLYPENWDLMLDFVQNIVRAFPIGIDATQFAVLKFSSTANVEFYLNRHRNKQELLDAIKNLHKSSGGTNIAAALRLARTDVFTSFRGDRSDAKNIALIITDGNPNENAKAVPDETRYLKEAGVEIFAVGITDDVDDLTLNGLASDPDNTHVFRVKDFNKLTDIVEQVIRRSCQVIPDTIAPQPSPTSTMRPTSTTTVTTRTSTRAPTTTRAPTLKPVQDCSGNADVVFILDASGSIGEINFNTMLNFVRTVVNDVAIEEGNIRLGVLTFSNSEEVQFHLNAYSTRPSMLSAIDKIRYARGTTNTAAALRYARTNMFQTFNGDRPGTQNIVIVLTDGESNNGVETLEEARESKTSGIHIISVGVGNWIDRYELEAMASHPYRDNMIHVQNFNALEGIKDRIRNIVCDNTNQCINNNPCRNGATCRNDVGYYWCENCRSGFGGKNCDSECKNSADLVIAVDASGSIGLENFKKIIDYVIEVVTRLDISNGGGGTRVGMLTFADNAKLEFNLNKYTKKRELMNALNVRYTGGKTNTADAFRYIREQMFTPANGDRANVPNMVLVITDGRSNDPQETFRQVVQARNQGIHVLALGVGGGVDLVELQGMASEPTNTNMIRVQDFNSLGSTISQLSNAVCNNVDECQARPCFNGARCTDLINGYTCGPCPEGYTGPDCQRRCDGKADVVIVIDSSGSIRRERFPEVKEFAMSLVRQLDVHQDRARVGVAYYSDQAQMAFQMNTYTRKQDVIQAINYIPFLGGRTNTQAGLSVMRQLFRPGNGERQDVANYALVITDGNSNIDPQRTIPEAIEARVEGIHISVVAVGKLLNKHELEGIASEPKDKNIFSVDKISQLNTITTEVIKATCDDVDECLSNPCQNGGRCVNTVQRYFCRCPSGFTGYNCQRRCTRQFDVVFVLDFSGSVEEEYKMIVSFVKKIVYGLDMEFGRTRIGLVTYATGSGDQFFMNKYNSKEAVINALNFYHIGGRTNTQDALRIMRTEHFTSINGDRSGVRNVAIVLSDGYSNVNQFNTIPEANQAKSSGIDMYSIALGENPNLRELNEVASDPDSEYVVRLRNINEVDRVADDLLDNLCQ